MTTVSQVIAEKGRTVHTISRDATVFEAVSAMVAANVGALVVRDGPHPCGMITERDYLRRVAVEGRSSKTTAVHEIMSSGLVFVDPDTDVEEGMALMTHRRVRHLPVLEGTRLVGIVSIGDLVKFVARARAGTIDELTAYIQGAYS